MLRSTWVAVWIFILFVCALFIGDITEIRMAATLVSCSFLAGVFLILRQMEQEK